MPKYISARDAAVQLGVSDVTVRQLLRAGRIRGAFKLDGWVVPDPPERALGTRGPSPRSGSMRLRKYLHEAMSDVMVVGVRYTTREITDEIARQRSYICRDGRAPSSSQIAARAASYEHLFRREGSYLVNIGNA